MATITVRARTPKGVFPIEGLSTSQTTLQQLKQKIQEKSSISSTRQKIKFGFPPKLLEAKDEDTLDKLGFKNGEMLTVEEGPEVVQAQPQEVASASSESQSGVAKSASVWMPSFNKFTGLPPKPSASVSDDQCSDGKFVRRIIPSDNSCLFASVRYCLEGTDGRKKSNLPLRQLISEVIGNNTSVYNEIFLGQKPQEYRQWILKPENWGGAIELAILADFYEVEICAFDIQSTRVDTFGQGKGYKTQIFILYDGIHYDALAFNVLGDEGPEEIDISLFSANDKNALSKAMVVVKELNKKRQFTDVGNFSLRCLVCGEGIKGSKEATLHAKQTGHQSFGEN